MDLSPDVTCVSLEARLLSAELSPSECWLVPADDAQVLPPPAPTPTLQLGARAGPPEAAVRSQAPAVRLVGAPPLAGALGDQPVDQSIEASPPPATPVRTCATDGGAAGSPLWRPAAVRSPAMPWAVPPTAPPRVHLCIAGNPLELMMAPGDVLVVRGSGRLAELGNAGGFMGHVLVVTGAPHGVARGSRAAAELAGAWPAGGVSELWQLPVVESTRRESGLYESSQLMCVDRRTRQLLLVGEIGPTGELSTCDPEPTELWQCPEELRRDMRVDVMMQVLADMRSHHGQANWSAGTAFRAIVKPAAMTARPASADTLKEIQSCWAKAPICTSVVIGFWQRYLSRLAGARDGPLAAALGSGPELAPGESVQYWSASRSQWIQGVVLRVNRGAEGGAQSYDLDVRWAVLPDRLRRCEQDAKSRAVGLIMRYMPLKADRALPGDLLKSMRECGWVSITQVPQIFRPVVVPHAPRCPPVEFEHSPSALSHQC